MKSLSKLLLALIPLVPTPVVSAQNSTLSLLPDTPTYSELRQQEQIRAWKRSLVPVAASQALDVASSYGLRELNPVLAGADGRFGPKAAAVKLGATGAILGIEYLVVKKYPKSARVFSKLNWSSSIVTASFAAHNFAIR